jgi:hypothetical protein
MRDVSSGYSISLDRAVSALRVRLAPAMNTGIMLFRREHVSDVEYLADDYLISMQPGPDNVVARHYAGPSRTLLTREGMPRLLKAGLLEQRAPSTDNLSVLESKNPHYKGNEKGH